VKLLEDGLRDKDVKRVTRVITLRADKDLELIRNQFNEKHEEKLDGYAYKRLQWMGDHFYRDLLRDIIRGNEDLDTAMDFSFDDQTQTRYLFRARLSSCKPRKTVTSSYDYEENRPYF